MSQKRPKTAYIFYRTGNKDARRWAIKITSWLKKQHPNVLLTAKKPDVVLVLGGDGTILRAAKRFFRSGSGIFGLNLGDTGFLTSVRHEKDFLPSLQKVFRGAFRPVPRTMLSITVIRKGKTIFHELSLNEAAILNPLGMVYLDVIINGHPAQYVRGTGVLAATPTGSTAMNLSAHGPILAPELDCFIITELFDHHIPTPSIIAMPTDRVEFRIRTFRKRGLLQTTKSKLSADVFLAVDGESPLPLEKGDTVAVERSGATVIFLETERHHFYKSLQEKLGLR